MKAHSSVRQFLPLVWLLVFSTTDTLPQDLHRDPATTELTGRLEIVIYDDFENRRSWTQHFLRTAEGNHLPVEFTTPSHVPLDSQIVITGYIVNGKLMPIKYEILRDVTAPRVNPNLGEQQTVILLANFQNDIHASLSLADVYMRFFDPEHPGSVTNYIEEVSFDKAWLRGEVFPANADSTGWYIIPSDDDELPCNSNTGFVDVLTAVIQEADADVDFRNYTRLFVVFPHNNACSPSAALLGIRDIETLDGIAQLSVAILYGVPLDHGVAVHEFGHQLGLLHANDWECGDVVIGDTCVTVQYGDIFDVMGHTGPYGHFNAPHKYTAGWFAESNVLETNEPGVYRIYPLETNTTYLQCLKVPRGDGFSYFVEYRRPLGYDAIFALFPKGTLDGVLIHIDEYELAGDTQLLDTTPNSDPNQEIDSVDVVLLQGETFIDFDNDISITTMSLSDEFLEVLLSCVCAEGHSCAGPCHDGDPCTQTDVCSAGVCVGTEIDCNDGNVCTTDSCSFGTCVNESMPGATCNDSDVCTVDDMCDILGNCLGTPMDCNDQNDCTADSCIGGECLHTPLSGTNCDDLDPCTENDTCSGGICSGTQKDCSNLDDQCNLGTCNQVNGSCIQLAINEGASCDDEDTCTFSDVCVAGTCQGTGHCQLHGDVFPVGPPTGNCVVDIDDLLITLGAFAASPNHCASAGGNFPDSTNLFPCGQACQDGVVDIDDVVSELAAFAGFYDCLHPCQP